MLVTVAFVVFGVCLVAALIALPFVWRSRARNPVLFVLGVTVTLVAAVALTARPRLEEWLRTSVIATLERTRVAPWGLAGGGDGGPGSLLMDPDAPTERALPPKVWDHALRAGDRVRIRTAGGGGYSRAAPP